MIARSRYINVKGSLIDLSLPRVMGVINVTPDSFYKRSRFATDKEIAEAASAMIEDGADILDIGGFSSRPGASDVTPEVEKNRVLKAVKLVARLFPGAIISVDTFRAEIAMEAVLDYGAAIINDISGGEADDKMFKIVRKLQVPYVMMHMQGVPSTMQNNPVYDNVTADVLKWFGERIVRLQSEGVNDIILDPGFGFGKTVSQNFELLNHLCDFSIAGLPLLVGISRKSMVWKTLEITPANALNGTSVLNMVALMNGADILRVHDVKEAVQVIKLFVRLKKEVD